MAGLISCHRDLQRPRVRQSDILTGKAHHAPRDIQRVLSQPPAYAPASTPRHPDQSFASTCGVPRSGCNALHLSYRIITFFEVHCSNVSGVTTVTSCTTSCPFSRFFFLHEIAVPGLPSPASKAPSARHHSQSLQSSSAHRPPYECFASAEPPRGPSAPGSKARPDPQSLIPAGRIPCSGIAAR